MQSTKKYSECNIYYYFNNMFRKIFYVNELLRKNYK